MGTGRRDSSTENGAPSADSAQYADMSEISRLVASCFPVLNVRMEPTAPTFVLHKGCETKEPFKRLFILLRPYGLVPVLRWQSSELVLRLAVAPKKMHSRIWVNLALLGATIGTVTLAGILFSYDPVLIYLGQRMSQVFQPSAAVASYVGATMGVFGLHEVGHKIAGRRHKISASLPYFLPGIPYSGGTFGAVIMQESPPVNRDQLLDLGISGPLLGLLVTVPILMVGLKLSYVVPPNIVEELRGQGLLAGGKGLPVPLVFSLLADALLKVPPDSTVFIHPVTFAGWLGLIVTFLNILPIAQLDGGHIFRAAFKQNIHQIISFVAVGFLFLMQLWFFGLLALFMMWRGGHPGALDDVSGISLSRKLLLMVIPIIWVMTFTPLYLLGA